MGNVSIIFNVVGKSANILNGSCMFMHAIYPETCVIQWALVDI